MLATIGAKVETNYAPRSRKIKLESFSDRSALPTRLAIRQGRLNQPPVSFLCGFHITKAMYLLALRSVPQRGKVETSVNLGLAILILWCVHFPKLNSVLRMEWRLLASQQSRFLSKDIPAAARSLLQPCSRPCCGAAEKISDLIFSPGRPPQVQVYGQLIPVQVPGLSNLTADDTRHIAADLIGDNKQAVATFA